MIVDGISAINEAPVTGESVPKSKKPGDDVFAGTINGEAVIRVRVTAAAKDNTIARIVRLVEEAQESKAPTERFIDRFARYYTPGVLVAGALVAILPPLLFGGPWDEWIYKGLAILLIGCPCALVISTPAAIAAGLSAGARRGLLLKGGAVLENLRNVKIVALDKTGTLTEGRPKVTDVVGVAMPEQKVLSLAAALETGSSHPLAVAILARAKADKVPIPPATAAKAIPGKGVTGRVGGIEVFLASPKAAEERVALGDDLKARIAALNDAGKTVAIVIAGAEVAGLIAIRDEPRPDATAGLKALRDAGIETVMLTGDNERTANAIGRSLGIRSGPSCCRRTSSGSSANCRRRAASSPRSATASTMPRRSPPPTSASPWAAAPTWRSRPPTRRSCTAASTDIADLIALSKATMRNIRQNITVALGLKAVFLVTTIAGITGLWPAILADTGATVLVTVNAMRLLAWKPQERS